MIFMVGEIPSSLELSLNPSGSADVLEALLLQRAKSVAFWRGAAETAAVRVRKSKAFLLLVHGARVAAIAFDALVARSMHWRAVARRCHAMLMFIIEVGRSS